MSKKTIKELAEEIGVSKTAITKKVTEAQKKKWFTKIGNQFVIDEIGQNTIKSMFNKVEDNHSQTETQTSLRNNTNQVIDLDFYKSQISAKDNQIETLQNLLKEQQTLLDQQQQLTLQSNNHIERLQLELSKETEEKTSQNKPETSTNNENEEEVEPKKKEAQKGFFSRLFKR